MDLPFVLVGAGFLAGVMNAAAGGGSFLTFPALVLAGLPPVTANASSTVALFPGSLASAWAYREDVTGLDGLPLGLLLVVSLVGGFAGALLLLATPPATFDAVIPWLLLLASLAFAYGRQTGAALRRRLRIGPAPVLALQFLLGVYGGYFGGAVGIMMMAVWSVLGAADLKAMNPAKTILVAAANAIAVVCFAAAGAVRWPETLVLSVAAVIGGYLGARTARRLDPRVIRIGVISITVAMTIVFFLRAY